jgi:cell division septation protein DedD
LFCIEQVVDGWRRGAMRGFLYLIAVLALAVSGALAQKQSHDLTSKHETPSAGPDIKPYLTMIETGKAEQARGDLPSLLSRYPNDPGVLYLQARLTTDGAEAVRIYQSIVDNFPKSEWADQALYKVYQFYYALGLYRTAELKMQQLKRDYPASPFAVQTSDVDSKTLAEEQAPPPEQAGPDTTPIPDVAASGTGGAGEARKEFTLQVGAFTEQANAERQKKLFEDLGMPVEIIHKVQDVRSLFLVHVGTYATYDEAKAKGAELHKSQNVNPIVITR